MHYTQKKAKDLAESTMGLQRKGYMLSNLLLEENIWKGFGN